MEEWGEKGTWIKRFSLLTKALMVNSLVIEP